MRAVGVSAVLAGLLLAAGAAPAEAENLHGYTHRGMHVTITTDAQGRATEAVYYWRVRRCDLGRYSYRGATAVDSKKRPTAHFFTNNPYTVRSRGGFRTRVTVRSNARRLSFYRWRGTFSVAAIIRRHGRVVDRCHIRRLHWTASIPEMHIHLSGDAGDFIMQGGSYSFSNPKDRFSGLLVPGEITLEAGGFKVEFRTAWDRPLKRGRYRHAGWPRTRTRHGFRLSGNGRQCRRVDADLTIRRIVYDRNFLQRFSASFVQHCDGNKAAAARGTVTYRR
jgi:hypothetical protein